MASLDWRSELKTALVLLAIVLATAAGDYALKLASLKTSSFKNWTFVIGALLYALPAAGWVILMRSHSLAQIGVIYSASTIIILAAMGVIFFREAISPRDMLGVALALAAVVVASSDH